MINEQEFNLLLDKYRSGNCTEEEVQLIDRYLENKQSPIDDTLISDDLVQSNFKRIFAAVDAHERHRFKRKQSFNFIKIAASLLLFLSASMAVYYNKTAIYNTINPLTYTNVAAKAGENVIVNLPDGSIVELNQRSRLSYSNRFNEQLREVSLVGEAYFQVAKNKHKPFIVHSGALNTRVLGTSFNIEAYPFSKTIAVELITGKVWLTTNAVKNNRLNMVLSPNQAVTYNIVNGVAEKHDVLKAENYIAWTDGKIKFSNTPMTEVIRRLNTAFQRHIQLADQTLAYQTIYGEFRLNERPTDIVKAICQLIKAGYSVRSDGTIVIKSNRVLTLKEKT